MGENGGGDFDDWTALITSPQGLIPDESGEKFGNVVVKKEVKVEEAGWDIENGNVGPEVRIGGSIAERRAAKCGFNASMIDVARVRAPGPPPSPRARSPLVTIPSGISPTALLDSPVMLPNPLVTCLSLVGWREPREAYPLIGMRVEDWSQQEMGRGLDSRGVFDAWRSRISDNCSIPSYQTLASMQPPMDFEFPVEFPKDTALRNCATGSPVEVKDSTNMIPSASCAALQSYHADSAINPTTPLREPTRGDDGGAQHLLEGNQKWAFPLMGISKNAEDGYNWRKYGQKHVKGSEFPRSYYKCTHPDCLVKKKVERSHDGQITEIVYKGAHNHHASRPSLLVSPFLQNEVPDNVDGGCSSVKAEDGAVWRSIQLGCKDIKVDADWRVDGLERTSSTSVVTETSDPLSTPQEKTKGVLESVGTPELSSTLRSHDGDDEDGATQGSISPGGDADDEESEQKRSKLAEINVASRNVREPRVVVQIESEVDILDDGYRWRKYGQKVVKGNPNPRSYYKCTSAGCPVRKHVERAADNLKSVITTYEGKHIHEVPATKNSSQVNSTAGNPPAATSNIPLPKIANVPQPEPHVQDHIIHFERKPALGNEYMKPCLLGKFGSDAKFRPSSIYQMQFPSLQNSMPYASFGMNTNHNETYPAYSMAPVLPDFPIPVPMSIQGSSNMALGGSDNHGNSIGPIRSFLGGQQLRGTDLRFVKPKLEQEDNLYDNRPHISDHENASSSSPMFCRVVGSLPN
ncbi:hypothetical protein RJ639_031945 [Escallonia herrerae]|uniref:WRKY domain-containing protein n=1 Tax=Escallonia herrerae TaxID=1293975 RepID=A0AA88X0J7_9ASTE|nr:hypothetical protein RJ639_031945 [Escallonia herrerae]